MAQIWKYPIEIEDEQIVIMPQGAQILTVQLQGGMVCLWALVDPSNEIRPRSIKV